MDANWSDNPIVCTCCSFNPRARDGRERKGSNLCHCRPRFNPRARDGREEQTFYKHSSGSRFNPRARDGREQSMAAASPCILVSIHAPVMDANIKLAS